MSDLSQKISGSTASFPEYVARLFWGDDLQMIDRSRHKSYIAQTIFEKGDIAAVRWMVSEYGFDALTGLLPTLRLTDRSRQFWQRFLVFFVDRKI